MQLTWLLFIAAVLDCAHPVSLHANAVLTEELAAVGALFRPGLHDEFAKTAHKYVECGLQSRSLVDLRT